MNFPQHGSTEDSVTFPNRVAIWGVQIWRYSTFKSQGLGNEDLLVVQSTYKGSWGPMLQVVW